MGNAELEEAQRLSVETTIQAMLTQIVAAGLVLIGAYFTFAQLEATTFELSLRARETALDRLSSATDRLASPIPEVRVSGLESLGMLIGVRDIEPRTGYSILAAYIRRTTPLPPTNEQIRDQQLPPRLQGRGSLSATAPDAALALSLLGTKTEERLGGLPFIADLRNTDLRGAILTNANLSGSNLRGALLEDTECRTYIDLTGANLRGASLKRVNFGSANLTRAHLEGADFTGAELRLTDLSGATADNSTKWPSGFEPRDHGVKVRS
jgi:Pentapeptide repeats (8 copies)